MLLASKGFFFQTKAKNAKFPYPMFSTPTKLCHVSQKLFIV
jgi:hypothetical protein